MSATEPQVADHRALGTERAVGDGPAPPPAGPPPGRDRPQARARRLLVETTSVGVIAACIAALVYRVWDVNLRLPLTEVRGDTTLIASMVKTIDERGWYLTNPRLGAPFGQQLYDFPHGGETFQLAAVRAIAAATDDVGLIMNVYYLTGFGVVAAVMFLVLRHLRFGPVVAAVVALVYAFLPYHFAHEQRHLYRSTYLSAPLAGLLLVWAQCWRGRFLRDPQAIRDGWRSNVRWPRVAGAIALCVVIAGTETMTTAFTMALLAASAVVGAIRHREGSPLVVSGLLVAVLAATFLVLSAPTLRYFLANGTNDQAAKRTVVESEYYALKLSMVLLPSGEHRVAPLAELGRRAQEGTPIRSEGGQALGVLGVAGLAAALFGAMANGLGRQPPQRTELRPPHDRRALWDHAGVLTVLALLFGSLGGLSVLLALAGFSQVRVWNRIVILVAFFAFVLVATALERVTAVLRRRRWCSRPVLGALAVAVCVVGLLDAIPDQRRHHRRTEREWASDRAFVGAIEQQMPPGAAIFQLPVLAFPETSTPPGMADYDPLRGFLADDGTLRWSYGAVKGRPDADWQVRVQDEVGPVGALPALLGLGFTGLWIDTRGYGPGTTDVADLGRVLGSAPLRSPDGRFLFHDLRPYRQRLSASDAELRATARRVLGVAPPPRGP